MDGSGIRDTQESRSGGIVTNKCGECGAWFESVDTHPCMIRGKRERELKEVMQGILDELKTLTQEVKKITGGQDGRSGS
jgi:hypothetical protein